MAEIMIVDDNDSFRTVFAETLISLKHKVLEAKSGEDALSALSTTIPDMVFLDLRMPGEDGLSVLKSIRQDLRLQQMPVIILTAFADSNNTIEAMKLGAFDHLTKPVGRQDLISVIDKCLSSVRSPGLEQTAGEALVDTAKDALIGVSRSFREVEKLIGLAASKQSPVMICGGTGSGKKSVARSIHKHGNARDLPFLVIPCASPDSGFENWKDQGTVYLEELTDLDASAQTRLLVLLRESQGGGPRVLCGTSHDLTEFVKDKKFREDLYYQISIFPVTLPSLHSRGSDVLVLAEFMLHRLSPENPKRLTSAASKALLEHSWPGNVRELQNVIERAHVVSRGQAIDSSDLFCNQQDGSADFSLNDLLQLDYYGAVARLEKMLLGKALVDAGGNRAEAARILGINRQLLYAKLKEHGIA